MQTPQCGRCGRQMEEGYMVDTHDHGMVRPSEWVEGQPRKFLFFFIRTTGRRRARIRAWHCSSCGLLELYARPDE